MMKIKKKLSRFKSFDIKDWLKRIVAFYNNWYGIFSVVIGFVLLTAELPQGLTIFVLVVAVFDFITWWMRIARNLKCKGELLANCRQNNVLAIYGGIGAGKSTLAMWLLNKFVPKNKQYTNTKTIGRKIFTNRHLLLLDKLESDCGVLIDEAGRQYDSFKYSSKDNEVRSRIVTFNKFFRQFHSNKAFSIYVDQCEANMNTALYRSIFYVIQCRGLQTKPSAIVPWLICKIVSLFKRNFQNPFTVVCINYMEFTKMGEYAEHYSVNIEDKDHKCLCLPVQEVFGHHDTYVFKDFNPAVPTKSFVWGENKDADNFYMEQNFDLSSLREELDINIDIKKYKEG